jgi:hypothetical protein
MGDDLFVRLELDHDGSGILSRGICEDQEGFDRSEWVSQEALWWHLYTFDVWWLPHSSTYGSSLEDAKATKKGQKGAWRPQV